MAADVDTPLPVSLLRGLNEFRLRVVDAAGNRSRAVSVPSAYDADPVAPSGLQLVVNDHDVSLQWEANPEDSIRGYRLFRRGAAVLSDEFVQPAMAWVYAAGQNPFEQAVLVDGDPDTGSYFFTRDDRDQLLEIALPAESLVVGLHLDAVQDWSASEQVRLEGLWEGRWIELPSVATVESGERIAIRPEQPYVATRLRLAFRTEDALGGRIRIGEVTALSRPLLATTNFAETLPDGAYLYRVSAVNQYGFEGPRSEAMEAQVGDAQAPDPVVLSSSQIDADVSLSWSESTAPDLAAYRLYRRGQLLIEITDLAQRSYIDAALPNGVYDYQVYAVDGVGNAAGSNVVVHTISGSVPAEPLNLAVSPVDGGGALRLQWSPGLGAPASEYRISRALQATGPFQPIVQVPAAPTTYVNDGLQNGVRYYYVVAALDARGNASANSNVADGVPFANERLATPVFTYPTRFGQSVTLPGPDTVVAGVAEPDSRLLLGYRDQLWPEVDLAADAEIYGVGYGGQRSAINAAASWIWNDYGYTAVLQTLNPDGGSDEIDLGQACARAQWLTPTTLLHCDGQTLPERLLRLDVATLDQSELALSQAGIRAFQLSADGRNWLLLANFDWPDGSRDSLAIRRDEGPWQELAVDAFDVDPDSLQMDPSSRWALLRRSNDERLLKLDLTSGVLIEIDASIAAATPVGFHPDQAMAVL
ncbi:MAG: hypothetical protein KDI56_03040, partial [Xanthomonadales bacterium]|nr:hypothetical protein [Xanthomonadales bacterium]